MFRYSIEEEKAFHASVARGMMLVSIPTFISLLLLRSPFGKHAPDKNDSSKWWLGPLLPARLSWFAFEILNVVWAVLCWSQRSQQTFKPINGFLLSLFVIHYVNRAIIYPLRMKGSKPMPLLVVVCALIFCTFNGYLQSQGLCQFTVYPPNYALSFRFITGITLFVIGFSINQHSDSIFLNLRKPGETGYKVPRGGAFEYVSGPHYLGEIIEWLGFAIAVNSFSAYAFLIYTASNLIPRGLSHHQWYKDKFKDYPKNRKAVLPFCL